MSASALDFCDWLKCILEACELTTLNEQQLQMVKDRLARVNMQNA